MQQITIDKEYAAAFADAFAEAEALKRGFVLGVDQALKAMAMAMRHKEAPDAQRDGLPKTTDPADAG